MQMLAEVRILLVDDEPNILSFLDLGLSNEGFKVQIAQDGVTAIEVSQQFQPHVVILDFMMPDMNGFEVCKFLKRNGDGAIIMLTARDEAYEQIQDFGVGVDDFLAKPFSFEELLKRIKITISSQFPYLLGEVV